MPKPINEILDDDITSAAQNWSEEIKEKQKRCSLKVGLNAEKVFDGPNDGRLGSYVKGLTRPRFSMVRKRVKTIVEMATNTGLIRSMSEGYTPKAKTRSKSIFSSILSNLSGSSRNSSSRTATRTTTDDLDLCDFPVKPYYNDYSDHSTSIPKSLQVRESKWTLRFENNHEGIDCYRASMDSMVDSMVGIKVMKGKVETPPTELELSFVQLRFTKSRRFVRICIFCVILLPIFSALVDDCAFIERELQSSTLRSVCIENEADVIRRRMVFMTIQLPISLLWFASTFFKFYTDWLPWIPSLFVLLYGGCSIATTIFGKLPDSGIYMNYLFVVWLFIRIPFYTAFVISWIIVISYCGARVATLSNLVPDSLLNAIIDTCYLIVMNIVLTYASYFWERTDRIEFIDSKVEAHIRANTQNLLNQIIPPAIQKRIKDQNRDAAETLDSSTMLGRGVIADEESDVSVLFSDIKGFTKFCSGVQAMDVVRTLNSLYNRFDSKLEKLGVYKVETIGDAYFVSANCPVKAKDHARRLVQLGHEMIQTCASFRPGGTRN